ncbi:autotransporter adhesin family protein [Treponema sp. TIM-1]|uniref:hypothetical protein n=1 Tax=Treponema sp. TIM-1 TaxID=2898417 RepID=UPI0039801182
MKGFKVLMVLCGAALVIAGCAIPMGDDFLITREGKTSLIYIIDYNLQTYVPIPSRGQPPVTGVNRGDLDLSVVWKDQSGNALPGLTVFADNTVYQAEIKLTPKEGYGFSPSNSFEYHPGKITAQSDDRGEPTRRVTVTYNNSDEAEITYITDYNLQSYVPIPMADEKPVRSVTHRGDVGVEVTWEVENPLNSGNFNPIPAGDSYTFVAGAVYRAGIKLTANPGYRFREMDFDYPAGTVSTPPGPDTDPDARDLRVEYKAAEAPTVISELNLTPYIPKPASGGTAVTSFGGAQYTGTVTWKNTATQAVLVGPFQAGTEYTAEVSLTAAIGYTFAGVGQDAFIYTGAKTVTNPAHSGTVSLGFSATGNVSVVTVSETDLTGRIPKPAYGVTPVTSFAGGQYTGTVVWKKTNTPAMLIGPFQRDTAYTAVLTLRAVPGFTFTGIGQNVFTHRGAAGAVTNPAGSGTVTIDFPPDTIPGYTADTFGPVGVEGSALKLMMERRHDSLPLTIELPAGTEELKSNSAILVGDITSPTNVTIDGCHRVLEIKTPGTLLTVSNGVTLTLKNITLQGISGNNAPLVTVLYGGKLILDDGVTLTGNETTKKAGGVWINGGELVMNAGAAIKKMSADSYDSHGGGVLVDTDGKFTMNGGIIGGVNSANTASGGGDGVHVAGGVFDMYGGTIQSNETSGDWCGGGVNAGGIFNMYGGTIRGNKAIGYSSGGGVSVSGGQFTMNGDAVIEDNEAQGRYTGGGVYNGAGYTASFTMNGGTIRGNTAEGFESAGGVHASFSFTMNGGTIKGNTAEGSGSAGGVSIDSGAFYMNGGAIGGKEDGDANRASGANGVFDRSFFSMSGGTIEGNTADDTNNYGVYIKGGSPFTMSELARVAQDNVVFLEPGATITIDNTLRKPSPVATIIAGGSPSSGTTRLLRASSRTLIEENCNKFHYGAALGYIDNTAVQGTGTDMNTWYGVYKEEE